MSDTRTHTPAELHIIASIIKQQIGFWPMAEVGARDYAAGNWTLIGMDFPMPGLFFAAKPAYRLVNVYVLLTPSDVYRVVVKNRRTGATIHEYTDVYAADLAGIIRNLISVA